MPATKTKQVERKALTVEEFSKALGGKSRYYGYELIRKKKVRAVRGYGALLIPISELDRILSEAQ